MATKTAVVRQIDGLSLAGRTETKHWVVMDGPDAVGGHDAGPRPKELLLLALGGCTGSDVIAILRKKRVDVDAFEIRLTAEQADEHPQVFTRIHVEYIVTGRDVRPWDVERAIELSQTKYCAVSAMLRPAVAITHSCRIVEAGRVLDPAGAA